MPKPDAEAQVAVAKITAWQAIIVTIISALTGVIGAVIGTQMKPDSARPSFQHYLTIARVESRFEMLHPTVRIVADINGQALSYPSRALWTDIGPSMSSEAFPLPANQTQYSIRFQAFLRDDSGKVVQLLDQQEHLIPASALPVTREYHLNRTADGLILVHSGGLLVHYEIR